jgi:signal transduction histidine kinase
MYIDMVPDYSLPFKRFQHESIGLWRLLKLLVSRHQVDIAYLDLSQMVAEFVYQVQPTYRMHTLRFEHATSPVIVLGNTWCIEHILYHLVQNAVKYSSTGGIIQIRVGRQGQAGYVEISDQGCGIGQDDLSYIFDCFYRGQRSRGPNRPGLGIGLAVVRRLVGQLNGQIDVVSAADQGSSFRVTLPA